jgi:diguanylate cyclase (GGDEF)-like protein
VVADAKAGKTRDQTLSRNGRSLRVVDQPMKGGGWVATFEDITEWQAAQEQIAHMARHDALTNLPNRTLFREQLEKALRLVRRSDQLAVLCLDLDHFKDINDSLGHPVGDALLKEVGRRLGECVTEHDTVARLGGDEFAIVQFCRDCEPSAVAMLASQVVEKVSAPYEIFGHQLVIGVSIGISLAPEDGKNPDELLKKADLALYRAKADGRGTYRYFETGMDARAQARRLLELDLRAALKRGEFEVYYQPIRDVAKDVVVAFEALVRWNHSLRGMISPVNFIPLAEETGLIVRSAIGCCARPAWTRSAGRRMSALPSTCRRCSSRIRAWYRREGGAEGLRPSGAAARTGDNGIGAAAEQRGDAGGSARASRLWRQDIARRFWNRIFVTELPAQLPVRQDQDRPFVRERPGDARGFDGHRPCRYQPRQEPRHRHHG